ncbi:EAL domain-containing protein [Bacillus sp. CGMCC 1.60114]|uniref:EAL domain-containing protein n=1 Tax=unclassified Bacillus (in: firmicutes) TaxID=185979 RepID=UPI0036361012
MQQLIGSYNNWFVSLSVVIAVFASYAALNLVRRIVHSNKKQRKLWLFFGSITMGIGIWSMHFIGMLAFQLPISIKYNPKLVLFSMFVSCIASLIGLYSVSYLQVKRVHFVLGGSSMGIAIGAMHYIGMEAMESVDIEYDPFLFILSILIAIVASIAVLKILFEVSKYENSIRDNIYKFISAIAMGIAIAGMHYTEVAAASFSLPSALTVPSGMSHYTLVIMVGITTIMIQFFLVFGTVTDRRFRFQAIELLENEKRYRSLVNHNLDAVFSISYDGRLVSMNPAGEEMLGYRERELQNKKMIHVLTREEKQKVKVYFYQTIHARKAHNFNTKIKVEDDSVLDLNITLVPVYIEERLDCIYGIARDITEQLENEENIFRLAYYDNLTELPNRRNFTEKLEATLKDCVGNNEKCAVFFLDLNRFKVINDALGHNVGDILLKQVANKLAMKVGKRGIVARLGGDAFTILLPNIQSKQEPIQLAKQIMHTFEEPFIIEGNHLYCTVSIGIAIAPRDGVEVNTIMGRADIAMYTAKESRKSSYRLYSSAIGELSENQLVEEQQLRKAIENDEFTLHYQPQVHCETGEVVGVEALVRWQLPDGTMRSPLKFISLAEETGLIIPLGKLVLEKACRQARAWYDKGFSIRVSVNLSPRQFQAEDIVKTVADLLRKYKLSPHLLELEVTESMTMTNVERSKRLLRAFRNLGVMISIDDFGTGHSSLSYLKDYPIQKLKIDRSFIKDIHEDVRTKQITAAIIAMGQHIGLEITAEGVETEEQLAFLREHNCSYIQGYYFSKPLPACEFEELFLHTYKDKVV